MPSVLKRSNTEPHDDKLRLILLTSGNFLLLAKQVTELRGGKLRRECGNNTQNKDKDGGKGLQSSRIQSLDFNLSRISSIPESFLNFFGFYIPQNGNILIG